MTLKRLLLTPTRTTYKDVYQRSFSINADAGTMDRLGAIFMESGVAQNNEINEAHIANVIPDIITLDTNSVGISSIPNGWRTERLRFIMEVESLVGGILMSSYFQGYTEHSEMTISGMHDPNMQFYINSVTNVTIMQDPVTNQQIVRPHSTFNVITDQFGGVRYEETFNDNDFKLIRPVDLVNTLETSEMYGDGGAALTSLTGNLSTKVQTSKRNNHDPLSYFTKTVNAYVSSKSLSDLSQDSTDVLKTTSTILKEDSLNMLPFIHKLHELTGEITPTTFTLGTLEIIFPYASSVTFRTGGDTLINDSGILNSDVTEELHKPNIETMIATTIVHSLNSVMSENLLSRVALTASNLTGSDFVEVFPAESLIQGIDTVRYERAVLNKIKYVLMPSITRNGMLLVSFTAVSDLLGDTTVAVSVNNGPMIPYRLPTFADSLYAPVVSTPNKANMMADDLSVVLDSTYCGIDEPTNTILPNTW